MRKVIITSTLMVIGLLVQSCRHDKVPVTLIDYQQLEDCSISQNYDSAKLARKLIGSWKWVATSGWPSGEMKAYKDVEVTFDSAGAFIIIENSVVTTQGNWKFNFVRSEGYELDLNKSSNYLDGTIILCENQVLFHGGWEDLSDNLFEKAN